MPKRYGVAELPLDCLSAREGVALTLSSPQVMMMFVRRRFAPLLAVILWTALPAHSAPLPRSITPSRQFIIYGGTLPLRGAMSDLVEDTKEHLLRILQRKDEWKIPIVLNLQLPQANIPEVPLSRLHISQTGFGLKIQLDLMVAERIDPQRVQGDILRALFVEMIYRNHPQLPVGSEYAQAPPWLIEGVLARLSPAQQRPVVDLLKSALESDKVFSLPEFVRQRPERLDAPMRLLYRAYAAALLQLLIDQPGGPAHLAALMEHLPDATNDPLADLKVNFPALGDDITLMSYWKAAIARVASTTTQGFLLSYQETERELDELLRSPVPSAGKEKPTDLEHLGRTKPGSKQVPALRLLSKNLLVLAATAHPVLHPVVTEYQEITQRLASRKTGHVSQRLAAAKETRALLDRRMSDVSDYINWFEATQLSGESGAFEGYLKTAEKSGEEPKRRRDALSIYLDTIEMQF